MTTYITFTKSDNENQIVMGFLTIENMVHHIVLDINTLSTTDKKIVDNFIALIHTDQMIIAIENTEISFDGNIICSKNIDLRSRTTIDYNTHTAAQKTKINNFLNLLVNNKQNTNS